MSCSGKRPILFSLSSQCKQASFEMSRVNVCGIDLNVVFPVEKTITRQELTPNPKITKDKGQVQGASANGPGEKS